ncbi:MAG: AAA family ATPase [Vulcanimicrobiota bacterium]
MSQILSLEVERFKSFAAPAHMRLAPLTVLLGRNNSGKSSLIQSLLLLKQTLSEPRPEVQIQLDGNYLSAFNLRELTTGWPKAGDVVDGPSMTLRWEAEIDVDRALGELRQPDIANLKKHSKLEWLDNIPSPLTSKLRLHTQEVRGTTSISEIGLSSGLEKEELFRFESIQTGWRCWYRDIETAKLEVELDHFLPYLLIDRSQVGPRDRERAYFNAFHLLFSQPLEALKRLLAGFQYLGSIRTSPPSLYKTSNVAPQEIGVSGELAAQLLHRRQNDLVHYTLPTAEPPELVHERSLVEAVNDVLKELSINVDLSVEEVQEVGFRLLFGNASLPHVGRGLTYLLPLVELGLLADPLRFEAHGNLPLPDYISACNQVSHIALEEPEAHLHPKVQSRLANWLVGLARSNRRILVETHSDHLVRRLRGLVARAPAQSEIESWLINNVVIYEVEQDCQGHSTIRESRLTSTGGLECWPDDFMDEGSEEDSAIYYASLAKEPAADYSSLRIVHDPSDEPNL